ncbi:MAG: hypothetical protein ACYDBB_04990 [Armatimonadota bacterium]
MIRLICKASVVMLLFTTGIFFSNVMYGQADDLTPREKALKLTATAVSRFEAGDTERAKQFLEQAIKIDDTAYETHFWLGRIYAQKAASSSAARRNAIEQFRLAAQLQPYGDEGDLSRAWLLKLTGRPKNLLFVPVYRDGDHIYDGTNTVNLIQGLSPLVTKAGLELQLYPDDWNIQFQRVPTKEDLKKLSLNTEGLPHVGWVIFLGVNDVTVKSDRNFGNVGNVNADMWVGDAISTLLFPKSTVSATSLSLLDLIGKSNKGWGDAEKGAKQALTSVVLDRLQKMMTTESDPQLLDEILVPLRDTGIYCRSSAPSLKEAHQRKTISLYSSGPDDELGADVLRKLNVLVQRLILAKCNLNCISPTYSRQFMDDAPDDPVQASKQLLTGCRSDYGLLIHLEKADVSVKNDFLSKKIAVDFRATVVLASAEKGILWQGPITISDSTTKFLTGDVVDVMMKLRASATAKLIDAVNGKLTEVVGVVPSIPIPVTSDTSQLPGVIEPKADPKEKDPIQNPEKTPTVADPLPVTIAKSAEPTTPTTANRNRPSPLIAFSREYSLWIKKADGKEIEVGSPAKNEGIQDDFISAWSPDGKSLAIVISGDVWIVDINTLTFTSSIHGNDRPFVGVPAWTHDGSGLIVGRAHGGEEEGDGGLWIIDIPKGKVQQLFSPENADMQIHTHPQISPDGKKVASGGCITGAGILRVKTITSIDNIPISKNDSLKYATCYAWNSTGTKLLVGLSASEGFYGKGSGGIWCWDIPNNTVKKFALSGEHINEISVSPAGDKIVAIVGQRDKGEQFEIITIAGERKATIPLPNTMEIIVWVDNDHILCETPSVAEGSDIIQWDLSSRKSTMFISGGYGVALQPIGHP